MVAAEHIDIARPLGTTDLDAGPGGDVASLLASTGLDEIAAAVFRRQDGPPRPGRGYLAVTLPILLTVTSRSNSDRPDTPTHP